MYRPQWLKTETDQRMWQAWVELANSMSMHPLALIITAMREYLQRQGILWWEDKAVRTTREVTSGRLRNSENKIGR